MSIDVRALVRQVLDDSDASDLDVLVSLVFKAIPASGRTEALRQALRPLVREGISLDRMNHPAPSGGRPAPATSSWKVQAIREDWQRALRGRLHVGGGTWKLLGECTRDDLLTAAHEREVLAEQNAASARKYAALAAQLDRYNVTTVAELPDAVLGDSLGDAE